MPAAVARRPCSAALLAAAFVVATVPAPASEFIEDNGFLRVNIGGRPVRLEALTVKRADATGRLPIALIAHGKPANLQSMLDDRASTYIGQARDLASRGWLAVVPIRRGFGQSDGPIAVGVSCRTASFIERFSADADDLVAALDLVGRRPDADPNRAIAIGVSAGGAAVTALASRNPKNLRAAINISGGLRMRGCPQEDVLVGSFRAYGAKNRVPNLWLYAKNDTFFPPDLVYRMQTAFLDGGADMRLVMYEPIGSDGHNLFSLGSGRRMWLQEMDALLRFHKLPTWTREDVNRLMERLKAKSPSRPFVEGFVAAPLAKALARSPSGYMYGAWAHKAAADARTAAMNGCKKARPQEECNVVMENDRWVATAW